MKSYLEKKIGRKLGITRAGMPKEIYFEATLKELNDEVAVFEDEQGNEIALPLDKIMVIGPPERDQDKDRPKPGFF